jgi:hypothetical protein
MDIRVTSGVYDDCGLSDNGDDPYDDDDDDPIQNHFLEYLSERNILVACEELSHVELQSIPNTLTQINVITHPTALHRYGHHLARVAYSTGLRPDRIFHDKHFGTGMKALTLRWDTGIERPSWTSLYGLRDLSTIALEADYERAERKVGQWLVMRSNIVDDENGRFVLDRASKDYMPRQTRRRLHADSEFQDAIEDFVIARRRWAAADTIRKFWLQNY